MLASLPLVDKLTEFFANPLAVILASLSLADIGHAIAKKSWPYLLAPYTRFFKESVLLTRIIRDNQFSIWSRTRKRYVALQAIRMERATSIASTDSATPLAVLEELNTYLRQKKPVIVLGEPGAGKTTAIQALTYQLARAAFSQNALLAFGMLVASAIILLVGINWVFALTPLASLAFLEPLVRWSRVPLFVEARSDYAGGAVSKWCDELMEKSLGPKPLLGWGDRHFFLIDGMNEVPMHYQTFVEGWSKLLKEKKAKKSVVFTSRSNESPGLQLNINDEFEICELDDEGVERFLRAYGSELAETEGREYRDNEEKNDLAVLRNRGLVGKIGSKSLGRNPYWLKMLVESRLSTANKGALLLGFAKKLLLREIEEKPKGGRNADRPTVPLDLEMECLGSLAYAMHHALEIGFSSRGAQSKADSAVAPILVGSNYKLEDVLREGEAATLVRFKLPNVVEFQHQLVQEFFAAFSMRERLEEIARHVDDRFWWHTLILLGGLLYFEDQLARTKGKIARDFELYFQEILGDGQEVKRLLLAAAVLRNLDQQLPALTDRVLSSLRDDLAQKEVNDELRATVTQLAEIAEEELIVTLRSVVTSSSKDVAKAAIALIGSVKTAHAAETLNELLGEESFEDAARDALVAMGPAGIHALLGNLRDPTTDLSSPVSITLRRMVAAAPFVRPLLKDANPKVRRRAAYVLGGIRDPSTLEDLTYRLSTELFPPFYLGPDVEDREELVEPVDWVRVAVANAIGEFGDPRGLEMLKRSLEDESSEVRDAAVRALGTLRDARATPWLIEYRRKEKDKNIRRHVLEALGNIADPKAIEALLAELASTGDLVGAWTALESVGKRGVEHLGSLLRSLDADTRYIAARALSRVGDSTVVPFLTPLTDDEDERVRLEAFRALEFQSSTPQTFRFKALQDEALSIRDMAAAQARRSPEEATARALVGALRNTPGAAGTLRIFREVAVAPLAHALKDPIVRKVAAEILIDVGRKIDADSREKALKPVLDALDWPDLETRVSVVTVIAKVGGQFAIAPLREALHFPDGTVKKIAVQGLVTLGPVVVTQLADDLHDLDQTVSECAAEALEGATDRKVLSKLRALLRHSRETRFAALEVVSGVATDKTSTILLDAAVSNRRPLRDSALSALLMTKTSGIGPLTRALDDSRADIRGAAAWLLGQIGDERALEKLGRLANEDNRITMFDNTVAEAAKEAIASIHTREN